MKKAFPWGRTFLIGFGFLGISIVWPIFNSFIPIFLQAGNPEFERQLLEAGREIPNVVGFGLGPTFAFFVMTWDNLINVFVQPWAGARSDRTWNRFGRRKPWIMIGLPIAAVALVMIPLANTILAIMVFILITNFGMALFRSPTVAWLGDLFTSEERSQANGVINLMGGLGAAVALFGGGILFDEFGRSAPFIAGALLMVTVLVVALIFVKEPEKIQQDVKDKGQSVLQNLREVWAGENRSGIYVLLGILFWFMAYEALNTGLTSFAVFSLGLAPGQAAMMTTLFAAAFILFALPSGLIATRLGRKRTINYGLLGMIALFILGYVIIQDQLTLGIVLVLGGACWALVNVNSLPLVYDYGDENKIGAYTGLYYFSSQSAAVLGPVLGGRIVESLGFEYRWLWVFSAVFMGAAWLAMRAVREKTVQPSAAVA
ncbi:MAG: MFS transporter [Chloroflexi bacterium]|nr:MAG: MFS transporter [Chloroflexota bacterium]MBL1196514.1 MFS transporter [Chloroflexota bacterium]NOH13810.1 MFS transporter [Chloroflexota bacterium]